MSALERFAVAVLLLVALAIGGTLGVKWYGSSRYQAGVAAEREAAQGRALVATVARVQENAVEASKQQSINLDITEKKHAELAPVIRTIYVDRVRVGAASCGPTGAPQTDDAGGGPGADSTGRLVRADVERDTRALEEAVERHLATGRACQAWGVANGYAPPSASSEHSFKSATSDGENSTSEK